MARRNATAARPGFTLPELAVTVAIIALLISVLLPALSGARDAALRVGCLANLRQAGVLMHTYMDERTDGVLPVFAADANEFPNETRPAIGLWQLLADRAGVAGPEPGRPLFETAVCPADPAAPHNANVKGFSYEYWAGRLMRGDRDPAVDPLKAAPLTRGYRRDPSGLPLIIDDLLPPPPGRFSYMLYHRNTPAEASRGNALFFDGHAGWDGLRGG